MNNSSRMQCLWHRGTAPKHSAWKLTRLTPWLSTENVSAPGYLASQKPEDRPGAGKSSTRGWKARDGWGGPRSDAPDSLFLTPVWKPWELSSGGFCGRQKHWYGAAAAQSSWEKIPEKEQGNLTSLQLRCVPAFRLLHDCILKKWGSSHSMPQSKHFKVKIDEEWLCTLWSIHIFHRFSLPSLEHLCSLLILQAFPLLQQLYEKWTSVKQNLVSTKSVHKNLVCSLQMRATDLEDQIKVVCFQHTNKPVDVIKLPSQQRRSHWASLGCKINGLYSFIPCVILVLMRTEKKSFILYTVQYNRDFIIHFPGLLAVKGLGNPIWEGKSCL